MKLTPQTRKVLNKLLADGEVTNVWAMTNGIFRLSNKIAELEQNGYEFDGEGERRGHFVRGTKTYQYTLTKKPPKIVYEIDPIKRIAVPKIVT